MVLPLQGMAALNLTMLALTGLGNLLLLRSSLPLPFTPSPPPPGLPAVTLRIDEPLHMDIPPSGSFSGHIPWASSLDQWGFLSPRRRCSYSSVVVRSILCRRVPG